MIRLPSPNIILQTKNTIQNNQTAHIAPRLPINVNVGNTNSPPAFTPRYARPMPRFKNHPYKKYPHNNQTFNRGSVQSQQEHWCETCDRGFRSSQLLEEHKSEHQICGIDGCKFFAHPMIVTNHIQMQHSTGLYNRIRNLETPEDISRWINERKQNYPSKENIEKKKAQIDECIDRGEKIRDKKSRFNDRDRKNKDSVFPRRNDRKNKFNQRKKDRFNNRIPNNNQTVDAIKPQIEEQESYCGLEPFKGIVEIVRNDSMNEETIDVADNLNIEDEEWDDSKSKDTCKALSSLIAAYGSYDEESDNDTEATCSSNNVELKKSNLSDVICTKSNDSDDGAPVEVTVQRTDDIQKLIAMSINSDNNVEKVEEKPSRKRTRAANVKNESHAASDNKKNKITKHPPNTLERQIKYYKERPSTLLEKLLEKDIKHERNVLLQCVNYIVKNNFFDK